MMNEKIIIDSIEISKKTSNSLWEISNSFESPTKTSPKIIFPKIRNTNKIRICEQEARFVYSDILNQYDYFFSVETPTEELYGFSSNGKRSASTDLTLYILKEDKFKKIMNVEFKAHNPHYNHIEKDIQKLVFENIHGFWFHLLENIDLGTIKSLSKKFIDSFNEKHTLDYIQKNKLEEFSAIFYICVLNKKTSFFNHCYFNFEGNNFNIEKFKVYIQNFFNEITFFNQSIDYEKYQGGWKIWSKI